MTTHTIDTGAVFQAYVECALWSSTDNADDTGGEPLDANYGPDDIAAEALNSMRADVRDFLEGAPADALGFWATELGDAQIGHDFWLTRNRHGAGFWDRFGAGKGEAYGRVLTDMAKPYGESDLYIGDDGLVYVS